MRVNVEQFLPRALLDRSVPGDAGIEKTETRAADPLSWLDGPSVPRAPVLASSRKPTRRYRQNRRAA